MNEFITLDYLATFAGTVFAVNLLVQFTKRRLTSMSKYTLVDCVCVF